MSDNKLQEFMEDFGIQRQKQIPDWYDKLFPTQEPSNPFEQLMENIELRHEKQD